MPDYSRVINAQIAERRRKQMFFGVVAIITFGYLWFTWYSANKTEGFEYTDIDPSQEVTTTDNGLQFQDLVIGEGEIAGPGHMVAVLYAGWLTDETLFDSSVDSNEPFMFTLGAGRVIQGWEQGVAGMRVGGVRLLKIPPELAYGSSGAGSLIPGGATLIFQVELLEIVSE